MIQQRYFIIVGVLLSGVLMWPATIQAKATLASTDCANPNMGLTTHHTFMARSSQPRQFNENDNRIFRSASVPDILKITKTTEYFEKGDLVMYFSRSGLCMSVSRDGGDSWSSPKRVRIQDNPADGGAVDPSLVQLPNGKLRMYYYGPTSSSGDPALIPGDHTMYSAHSYNGLRFLRDSGKRYAAEDITDPEVVQLGDKWFMYLSHGQETVITRSSDGWRFTDTGKVWEGGGIPGAYAHDDVVDLFGCGGGAIVAARSSNGKDFGESRTVFAAAEQQICDPSPVQLNGTTYLLFYKKVISEDDDSSEDSK